MHVDIYNFEFEKENIEKEKQYVKYIRCNVSNGTSL